MKLALNGVYGDSNNEFSPFYDPQYTMTITINGQLSLCMLAERLLKIEGLELIQVNTDGVTAMVPKEYTDLSDQITKQWEKEVKLELEMAEYAMMAIRDVNNYIAIYTNGKVKRKGAYEFEGLGWHQNQGGLVIPMAACEALVYGKSIEEFIYNHGDKFDFMLRTKVPRSSRLVLVKNDVEVPQQNICRYYISKDGGELVKIMPPLEGKEEERRMGIDVGWKVKTCNNVKSFEWDIDYDYYIQEAKKLVDPLFASDLAESA
jgi:DNA polymerase elongation subunit (family B)